MEGGQTVIRSPAHPRRLRASSFTIEWDEGYEVSLLDWCPALCRGRKRRSAGEQEGWTCVVGWGSRWILGWGVGGGSIETVWVVF